MKLIKIKFIDFWPGFNEKENIFYEFLTKKFSIEFSDKPDFIFYSNYGYDHLLYKDCVRIFFSGENQTPDFNICDYAMGFHYIDFEDRYLRIPLYFLYKSDLNLATKKHIVNEEELLNKSKFANFVYSNANADPKRDQFFYLISKYKNVESGGRHINNIGRRVEDKLKFQEKTKFTIAFENSSSNGYSTEKILQAFSAKTIPIYWGDPNIANDFNDKSFINCHNYPNFEEVIKKVIEIDNDDNLYQEILRTPMFKTEKHIFELDNKIDSFLYSILIQEKESAFRRNLVYWGKKYENNLRIKFHFSHNTSLFRKIIRKAKSIIIKIKF